MSRDKRGSRAVLNPKTVSQQHLHANQLCVPLNSNPSELHIVSGSQVKTSNVKAKTSHTIPCKTTKDAINID